MQRMGGGGNDPSCGCDSSSFRGGGALSAASSVGCGCDMQAGWPSSLPRGGLQGGGSMNNVNSFNLALTNKTGKITHFRGKRNMNQNNSQNKKNMNNENTNMNMGNNNMNMGNNMNKNKNKNKNNKNKTKKNRTTSAPEELNKIVYKGNRYYTNKKSGNTYKRTANGNVGNYVGKLTTNNNGKKSLNKTVPESTPLTNIQSPPLLETVENIDIETEGTENEPMNGKSPLTQDGGSLESTLQKLQMAGGGMPVPDACPFPGTGYCGFYAKGGGCGCSAGLLKGGYRPTKKNLKALKKWKRGESIGFTMTSSLKAKGLIPRTSRKLKGKKVVSRKYR